MTITSIEPIDGVPSIPLVTLTLVRLHGAELPDKVFQTIAAYTGKSPADLAVRTAEALYLSVATAPDSEVRGAMAVACVQLADFCSLHGLHELGSTDRGQKMAGACRRLLGLGSQDPAEDPQPQTI